MVAVPEACVTAPAVGVGDGAPAAPAHCHRAVGIAGSTTELLRPESDLLRMISGIPHVDLLVAAADRPVSAPGAPAPLGPDRPPSPSDLDLYAADPFPVEDDLDEGEEADAYRAEIEAEVAALGLPGLHVHHLDLPAPLGADTEPDLVAALSELVGFDPEPGVHCLAPAAAASDAERSVLAGAARRIARIYGLPLRRYRGLELAVVPEQRSTT
jgi:hypothetical protein